LNSPWLALDSVLTRIRPRRQGLVLLIDASVIAVCWHITYLFRLGFERWISARPDYDSWVLLGLEAVYGLTLVALGVPKGMWRFSGFSEVKRLTVACVLAGTIGGAGVLALGLAEVPRAVLALHPVVSLMGLTLVRIGYRMLYEHMRSRIAGTAVETQRALILGAGGAARSLIAGIQRDGWVVVGLLDDDPGKQQARVAGVPVLGALDSVAAQAQTHGITHLIIAMPSATPIQRRRAIDLVMPTRLPVLTVPSAHELEEGTRQRVRDIEPDDLLGRKPVQLDESGISDVLRGAVVLVTGSGGSIGSELCRQVARYSPKSLVLYEQNEFNLYRIELELAEAFPDLHLESVIGDVQDLAGLREIFSRYRPQVIFHAAAYKHVPLMEGNALAALRNNVLGTWRAATAAAELQVQRFVLISTDKAVNPTNVMGATKRAAELVISYMAGRVKTTRFSAVRFGNVLGSSGSVIPRFKEQIAKGGPVTVTHPGITRYFMTIPEAARLVVQAAAMGESGQVFVLEMGEPVKIVELARDLIRLSGHTLDQIEIVFTGLRPGEKLYEELLAAADTTMPTSIERLRIARLNDVQSPDMVALWLDESQQFNANCGDESVRVHLARLVPEFAPARQVSLDPSSSAAS
jgi:FlaA1/EpsC-like NDP-sugar epimerase